MLIIVILISGNTRAWKYNQLKVDIPMEISECLKVFRYCVISDIWCQWHQSISMKCFVSRYDTFVRYLRAGHGVCGLSV